MDESEKIELVNRLRDSHSDLQSVLDHTHLKTLVHTDSGWTVRDILGHIASWDRQAALSLTAYKNGSEYSIPDLDETSFNQREVTKARILSEAALLEEWEKARDVLVESVMGIPPELFPGDLLYPWGNERGTVALLVDYMIEHDVEHRAEIAAAVNVSEEG